MCVRVCVFCKVCFRCRCSSCVLTGCVAVSGGCLSHHANWQPSALVLIWGGHVPTTLIHSREQRVHTWVHLTWQLPLANGGFDRFTSSCEQTCVSACEFERGPVWLLITALLCPLSRPCTLSSLLCRLFIDSAGHSASLMAAGSSMA